MATQHYLNMKGRNTSHAVKHEQMNLSASQLIGTLTGVNADHWKQETPVYHYLLLISACFL